MQFISLDSSWENSVIQVGGGFRQQLAVPCHTIFLMDTGLPWVLTILLKQIINYP